MSVVERTASRCFCLKSKRDLSRQRGVSEIDRDTAIFSACCNWSGSVLPRFSARRRIPAAAFGESEYFCGTVSKMADKEDAAAALRNSEVPARPRPGRRHHTRVQKAPRGWYPLLVHPH